MVSREKVVKKPGWLSHQGLPTMARFLQYGSAPPGSAIFLNSHTVIQETLQIQTTALNLASWVRQGTGQYLLGWDRMREWRDIRLQSASLIIENGTMWIYTFLWCILHIQGRKLVDLEPCIWVVNDFIISTKPFETSWNLIPYCWGQNTTWESARDAYSDLKICQILH